MRTVHVRLLLVTLGLGMFTAGALAGCGGDDSTGGTDQDAGTGDGSSTVDSGGGGDDGGPVGDGGQQDTGTAPQANANDLTIYLGQLAQLDGSASVPPSATFAWTVQSVPGGSAITTGSLLNANAAKTSFTPDVVGDYALKLTVTAGTANATKTVTVHAVPAQVFYTTYTYQQPDGAPLDGAVADLRVVAATGGAAQAVTCPFADKNTSIAAYVVEHGSYVGEGADWWEGPAGSDGRAVLTGYATEPDGGIKSTFYSVTTSTTCTGAKQPVVLDTVEIGGNITDGHHFVRISPDGTRVAFTRSVAGASYAIQTIGMDGTAPHVIAPMVLDVDAATLPEAGLNGQEIPTRWVSATKIAWGRSFGSRWEIVTADDANGAMPQLALTGNGKVVAFELLANGDFIVEGTAASDGGLSNAQDILVYHPNSITKEAELVRNLSNLSDAGGSFARGLTLSPDKTRVAFIAADSTAMPDAGGAGNSPYGLFTAPVDGSSAAARVPGVPNGGVGGQVIGNHGPRWIAGGTALSWEQDQGTFDAGDGAVPSRAAIVTAPATGGGFRVLATSDANGYVFSIPNASCSVARGPGSALMAMGSLAALLGLVARRRRKS